MKRLINRLICSIKGHKWVVFWTYYNGMAHCKCRRCNKSTDNYLWELM